MERLQRLFQQYLDNRLTPEEFTEFWQLLGQEEHWEQLSPGLQELWKAQPEHVLADQEWESKMKKLLAERGNGEGGRRRLLYIKRTAAAAAVLFLLAGGYWFFRASRGPKPAVAVIAHPQQEIRPGTNGAILSFTNGKTILLDTAHNGRLTNNVMKSDSSVRIGGEDGQIDKTEYVTLTTPRAHQQQLVLPDGSKVWLNAASSIHFPSAFQGTKREVTVTGEAYFEIAKNEGRPFVVKVGEAEVQVLGTAFNIMAYAGEANVQTTLLEGAVRVKKGMKEMILQPGQQNKIFSDGRLERIEHADVELAMAWKNGWQSFHAANLQTIMRQVERWYDVDVEYQGLLPADMTFSGEIPRTVNLSELLRVFERKDLHFSIDASQHKVFVTR